MKNLARVLLPIALTILILFGPACVINHSIVTQWRFWMVVLATIVMFGSQPSLAKADLFNPTDKYSMLGISVMGILVTNMSVIEWAMNAGRYQTPTPINYAGLCLVWCGLALRIYSIVSLKHYFSNLVEIQQEHKLIDKGIYGIMRHPSYTGAIMTIVGTMLWLNAMATLPFSLVLIGLAYYHRITQEENLLIQHFGDEYSTYRGKTGSLVPAIKIFQKK